MRVLLFLATNIAVVLVLSITLRLFGFQGFLDQSGTNLNINALALFAAVFGMGGSFISLLLSKWMAKRSTGAKVIDSPKTEVEQWLVNTVARQAKQAGIKTPEVAVYGGQELNAFATGANRNKALVAVSVGLLNNMSRDEVEAVLAHEVSHVANGDMITLALVQGVVNTFVIFLSRMIGFVIDRAVFKTRSGFGPGYWITVIVLEIVLGILASTIVMWFSRYREFKADQGGARLAGRGKMISALERLQVQHAPKELQGTLTAFAISGGKGSGFKALFRSHPPLEDRINALRSSTSL